MKNIFLASHHGFCAGVERAIQGLLEVVKMYHDRTVYALHGIVHNINVLNDFKNMGVIFTEDIESIPDYSVVVSSAHGVSRKIQEIADKKNLIYIDAVCPLVKKIHIEIQKYCSMQCYIVLIGHSSHPEIVGVLGHISGTDVSVINSVSDVAALPDIKGNIAYAVQTTLSIDDAHDIIHALRKRFPDIIEPRKDDICYATHNRQRSVKNMAQYVTTEGVILVIGSNMSSNSKNLVRVARECGIESHLIDSCYDIPDEWIHDKARIGITAGASAPKYLVQNLILYLSERYKCTVTNLSSDVESVKFKAITI